jgi:hypothetical protein
MKAGHACRRGPVPGCAALLSLLATVAHAQGVAQCPQVPCDDVRTVAAASTGVPVEHEFAATAGVTYYVTLSDLGAQYAAPQPLASLKLAITANDTLVSLVPIIGAGMGAATTTLVVDGPNSVATNGVATASFTATNAGSYRFHVIGAPANGNGAGPIGLAVSATQGGLALQSWSDSMGTAAPPQPSAEGIIEQSFAVSAAGAFRISVTDLDLPQALQGPPQLLLLQAGNVIAILPDPNTQALTTTMTLQTGTYQLFAVGLTAANASGGLFSASVIPVANGGGAPAVSWTVPVGATVAVGSSVQLNTGSQYSLALNDLAFPAPLSAVAVTAVDLSQGIAAAAVTGTGSQPFTAMGVTTSDTYQIYSASQAAASGAGSYAVQILAGGTTVLGSAQAVVGSTSALQPVSLVANVPAAGTYTATLTDFRIPSALGTADFALVQAGAIVGAARTSAGSITASLAAGSGTLTLLAFAGSSTANGSLIEFSVSDATGNLVFDQPRGVGAAFKPTQISITAKGTYQFTLADLAWPASFSQAGGQLTGILTQGGNVVGQIFGGGSLTSIPVTTTGNYFLSIVATPTGSDSAGTYAVNVSPAPAPPTVNLGADAASVASGGKVHLIWTTTGATSCMASGGGWSGTWTGALASANTVTSPAISVDTTFTLTCQGPGGSMAGSVSVTVTASRGGGGGLGMAVLLALAVALAIRCTAARRNASVM